MHMHTLEALPTADKPAAYAELARSLRALLDGEPDLVACAANMAALLYWSLPELNWAGFYLVEPRTGDLLLGPFQGKPACVRIPIGTGVCGTAAARRETVVVADVHAFEGHIACDSASNSEVVVPILDGERLIGVLDLDSPVPARFDADDARGLEVLVQVFVADARLRRLIAGVHHDCRMPRHERLRRLLAGRRAQGRGARASMDVLAASRNSPGRRCDRPIDDASGARQLFARDRYSPVRVSTRMTSPSLRNSGTRTTAPVSSFAGFWPPVAVSPRRPGSVSTILSSTCAGGSIAERHAVPQHDLAGRAVLEPDRRFAHRILAGGVLLEGVRHHEVPEVAVVVEVLHVGLDDVGRLDRLAGPEAALQRAAALQVADAHPVERLALARLHELVLDDRVRIAVEDDLEAGAEFVGAVAGHGSRTGVGGRDAAVGLPAGKPVILPVSAVFRQPPAWAPGGSQAPGIRTQRGNRASRATAMLPPASR